MIKSGKWNKKFKRKWVITICRCIPYLRMMCFGYCQDPNDMQQENGGMMMRGGPRGAMRGRGGAGRGMPRGGPMMARGGGAQMMGGGGSFSGGRPPMRWVFFLNLSPCNSLSFERYVCVVILSLYCCMLDICILILGSILPFLLFLYYYIVYIVATH